MRTFHFMICIHAVIFPSYYVYRVGSAGVQWKSEIFMCVVVVRANLCKLFIEIGGFDTPP